MSDNNQKIRKSSVSNSGLHPKPMRPQQPQAPPKSPAKPDKQAGKEGPKANPARKQPQAPPKSPAKPDKQAGKEGPKANPARKQPQAPPKSPAKPDKQAGKEGPKANPGRKQPQAPPKTTVKPDKQTPKEAQETDFAQIEADIAQAALNWSDAKFSKTLKRSLLIISVLFLLGLFMFLPSLRFQKIESNQLFFTDFEAVLKSSGLRENQHFLTAYGPSLKSLITGHYVLAEEKVLESFPQLKSIKIDFDYPGILNFEIEERIPVAFLDVSDLYVTLDRFGVVCGSYQKIPKGLPAIRGVEAIKMQLGEPILTNADDDLKACIAVMSSIVEADFESQGDAPLLNQVSEIRSSGYQRIVLKLNPKEADGELTVVVTNESQLKEDFLWLKRVLESGVLNDKLPGSLDIFGSRLVFRPDRPKAGEEEIDLSGN